MASDALAASQLISTGSANSDLQCGLTQCSLPNIATYGHVLLPFIGLGCILTLILNMFGFYLLFCHVDRFDEEQQANIEVAIEYTKLFVADLPITVIYIVLWVATSQQILISWVTVVAFILTLIDMTYTVYRSYCLLKQVGDNPDEIDDAAKLKYFCGTIPCVIAWLGLAVLYSLWDRFEGRHTSRVGAGYDVVAISLGDECVVDNEIFKAGVVQTRYFETLLMEKTFNVSNEFIYDDNAYFAEYGTSIDDIPNTLKFSVEFSYSDSLALKRSACIIRRYFDDGTEDDIVDVNSHSYCECLTDGIDSDDNKALQCHYSTWHCIYYDIILGAGQWTQKIDICLDECQFN